MFNLLFRNTCSEKSEVKIFYFRTFKMMDEFLDFAKIN